MRFALQWTGARVRAIRDVTPTIRLFEIEPEGDAPLRYPLGSHINIAVEIQGRPDTRSYSLVGEPTDDVYRIAVKLHPDSRGGSAYMWSLPVGARLTVSHPQSLFQIDFGRPEYLLIAGGIGITPIHGMALTLARRGERLRMLYAARSRAELAFGEELGDVLGPSLETFVLDEGQLLDVRLPLQELHPEGLAAVCGPLSLLDDTRRTWQNLGRDSTNLRFETFGDSGRWAPEPFTVRIAPDGPEVVVPETMSMLDALNQAGIEIISDCRRGECGLCAVHILELDGEIDHRDVFFSDAQKSENHKLCTCVSRAIGRITIDAGYRPD